MDTLTWQQLDQYFAKAAPALLSMGGTRGVQIGFDPASGRLFLRAPLEELASLPASPYAELTLEAKRAGRAAMMEVSVSSSHLYREFHRLAGLFTEELEHPGETPVGAFLAVAERWRELTAIRLLLSAEEQLGLFGELAILQALIREQGPDAVYSWTARESEIPERHDFRIQKVDLEIKSTRMAKRHHVIHGLRQLEPSAGHKLFLISLRFEAAGMSGGSSLVDRVRAVQQMLLTSKQALANFEVKLAAARYADTDSAHYQERLISADIPMLLPVDATCPRLIPWTIQQAIGTELASRIDSDVTYRINVEGLGTPLVNIREAGLFGSLLIE